MTSPTSTRLPIPRPPGCQALLAWDCGPHIELTLVSVKPELRRQGIGSEAVKRVQRAAASARKPVRLVVDRPKRRSLVRFYTSLGFEPAQGLEMVWDPRKEAA